MKEILVRDATENDFTRIIELNEAEVQQTSPMNMEKLYELAQISNYHRVAVAEDSVAAFLLAICEGAPYSNDNYAWFSARFPQFIYVDRIVVGSEFAGLRIGSLLYEDLFSYARSHGIKSVTCEYYIDPPNIASHLMAICLLNRELLAIWFLVLQGSCLHNSTRPCNEKHQPRSPTRCHRTDPSPPGTIETAPGSS